VCDKIVSTFAQRALAIIFENYSKHPNLNAILTKDNRNFEQPSRSPSYRTKVKILKKNISESSAKKFGFAYAQSARKCSNIEILAKVDGKESKFLSKIDQGHISL
jgi:hypothetical protein